MKSRDREEWGAEDTELWDDFTPSLDDPTMSRDVHEDPEAGENTMIFRPQEGMQTTFLESPETEVFYGGEAGGGKSFALVLDALRYVSEANYRAIIFRRTFDDLSELIDMAREIYVPCGGAYTEARHAFRWGNNAVVFFRHLQHLKNIYNHQGKQYDYIGFDELPQFPKLAYTYLFSRLRGKNPRIIRYQRSTGNPDGEGLLWVKNRFIDPMKPLVRAYFKTILDKDVKVAKGTPGAISRKFVPCIRAENHALMDNDPEYENRLDQLPEDKKRALKFGLWTIQDKPNQLISAASWEAAVSGKNKFKDDGCYTIGSDFGTYEGVDKSVEFLGKGNRPYRCRWWPTTKTVHLAQILANTMREVDSSRTRVGVDCIGPGTGVGDDLEEHHKMGEILERCTHKDKPWEEFIKTQKFYGVTDFDDLRSQMCWKFKLDMDNGDIDLSAFQTPAGYFEEFNTLQEEVMAHTFRVYLGKLIVLPKHELRKPELLGRSPDFFDALVIWNWTRRLHREQSHDIDTEYQADRYMTEWFRKTNEFHESELDRREEVYEDRGIDQGRYDD